MSKWFFYSPFQYNENLDEKTKVPNSSVLEPNLQSQFGRNVLHLNTIHQTFLWLWTDSFKYQYRATAFYD